MGSYLKDTLIVKENHCMKTNKQKIELSPKNKYALLIVDMQKEYYKGFSKDSMDKACEYINMAIDIFRKGNLPIIWIQDERKGGIVSGTKGYEIIDLLIQDKNDKFVNKIYRNGFNKTDLLNFVNENGIDTLIITGYSAAYCVLSTYRAAEDYDLRPLILKKALASDIDENIINFVENISNLITIEELEKIILYTK
jgi:nicotinamidase-related amidase